MNRSIILPALVTAFVALSPAGVALADNPHGAGDNPNPTGQPNQEAEPGTVPGFESPGFANAERHYAGSELNPEDSVGRCKQPTSPTDLAGRETDL